jgi:Zn-finger nucleic acid-binding protein
MREVDKHGVQIDTCTRCRGVWLDRGELEKLAALMSEGEPGSGFLAGRREADHRPPPSPRPYRYDDDDDDHRRHGDRYYGKHKKKVSRLLDFFD